MCGPRLITVAIPEPEALLVVPIVMEYVIRWSAGNFLTETEKEPRLPSVEGGAMASNSESATQYWLYPVNRASGYVLCVGGAEIPVTRENIWASIEANPQIIDAWHLATGYRMMRPADLVWIVDVHPQKAIVAVGRVKDVYESADGYWSADLAWDLAVTQALRKHPIWGTDYDQRAMSVVRATDQTRRVIDQWLGHGRVKGRGPKSVPDLDARQRVVRQIAQRQGQQVFRQMLLEAYGQQCAITGTSAVDVLEAAHIKPYMGPHSNVPHNGILLRADIHTLFDLGLIAVDEDYTVRVSSRLEGTEYEACRGTAIALPEDAARRPSVSALRARSKDFIA